MTSATLRARLLAESHRSDTDVVPSRVGTTRISAWVPGKCRKVASRISRHVNVLLAEAKRPIAGMPILNVDAARSIIVLKRSMAAGYSGVENELFYNPKTEMLFGDAKKSIEALIASVKGL
jgi:NAD/NADP transhydrogenase beta subunit